MKSVALDDALSSRLIARKLPVFAAREAYAKAIGRGLQAMGDAPPAGWTVRQLALGPAYAGAVAVERGAEAVRCWHWGEVTSSTR